MSVSLIIGNRPLCDVNTSGSTVLTFAGITSYLAQSFWAYESQTINRVFFTTGTITNGANYTVTVGIGTVDRSIGLPALQGGTGNTLLYNSSNTKTSLASNTSYIVDIPDFTTTAYQKYFFGLTVSATTGAFSHTTVVKGLNSIADNLNTTPLYYRTSSGIPILNPTYGDNRFTPFNWGYDSGNGITAWYNPFPGPSRYNSAVNATLSNIVGFTFTLDTDFEAIYVKSVNIDARTPSLLFPAGFGCSWHCILYDSDGTTALIGHTYTLYPNNAQITNFTLPLNAWLHNKKLYHIGFAGVSTSNPTSTSINTCDMPYEFQSALGFTSIYFTKAGGSASPSYITNRVIPFNLVVSDIRGSVQGSEGEINVY